MKKLFYLLFLLPLAFLASCNSDDDFPQVKLTLTASNVYQADADGTFYYVESEETPIVVDGLSAQTLLDGKNATVANVFYSINGLPLFGTEEEPTKPVIPANYLREGTNYIHINATVLQVDKSIAQCVLDIPVIAVESVDDLPSTIDQTSMGTYSVSMNIQPKK